MDVAAITLVRNVIAALDPSRFTMTDWVKDGPFTRKAVLHNCGTAACIGGWTEALLGDEQSIGSANDAGQLLGLNPDDADALFCPNNYGIPGRYTQEMAVATLDHLLATGEVKWA